jgi:hypothetical protein
MMAGAKLTDVLKSLGCKRAAIVNIIQTDINIMKVGE